MSKFEEFPKLETVYLTDAQVENGARSFEFAPVRILMNLTIRKGLRKGLFCISTPSVFVRMY